MQKAIEIATSIIVITNVLHINHQTKKIPLYINIITFIKQTTILIHFGQ